MLTKNDLETYIVSQMRSSIMKMRLANQRGEPKYVWSNLCSAVEDMAILMDIMFSSLPDDTKFVGLTAESVERGIAAGKAAQEQAAQERAELLKNESPIQPS